jgi:ATP-dependent DNA helicase RecG
VNLKELRKILEKGEDSQHQFKLRVENEKALSSEIVAMSNAVGGKIFIGVSDDGDLMGVNFKDLKKINNLISNTASQHIKSPVSLRSENIPMGEGLVVICLTIPEGIDKPYFDKDGIIWLKVGADKRKINSKEELRRFFQLSDQVHADETPTKAKIGTIDDSYFRQFIQQHYGYSMPKGDKNLKLLLENLDLVKGNCLNLAGLLLFGENPQIVKPSFIIKSIFFPGTTNDMDYYLDKEDHTGHFKEVFQKAIGFIMRCLPKVQSGKSVNSLSVPEISRIVFEELLVNALVHRDYFCESPIRVFVYQDRIEIISPGSLPNHLTILKLKAGISISRNPILCSYVSKGILPYSGLGTGIQRALEQYPHITFKDDKDLNQFKVIIHRKREHLFKYDTLSETLNETIKDTDASLLNLLKENPEMSYDEIAESLNKGRSTIYRSIIKLRREKKLKRMGSRKTGYWKVCESS